MTRIIIGILSFLMLTSCGKEELVVYLEGDIENIEYIVEGIHCYRSKYSGNSCHANLKNGYSEIRKDITGNEAKELIDNLLKGKTLQ